MTEDKNEKISAFAFNTGRLIEKIIIEETNNLQEVNNLLEARILYFRTKLSRGNSALHIALLKEFEETFKIGHK